MFASSARAGICWPAAGLPVAAGTGDQVRPLAMGDEQGGVIIIWEDESSGDSLLYAQRYNQRGVPLWTAGGVRLCTTTSNQTYATAVPDTFGGCIVFWQDDRGTYSQIYGQRIHLMGGRVWGEGGLQVNAYAAGQGSPQAVKDGSGGAVVVWCDARNDTGDGDIDLVACRLNGAGGTVYSTGTELVSFSGYPDGKPQVAADGSGGVFVGWGTDELNQDNNNVYAQHVTATGARSWSDFWAVGSVAAGYQGFVAVAADGVGGMWLAWEDRRDATTAVYLQRFNSSGTSLLPVGGARISHSARSSITPAMAPDGKGGAFIAYPADGGTVYYRHAMPGVDMLADNDQPLFTGGSNTWDGPLPMAPDGRYGCYVAWPDNRTGTRRMYIQQITEDGLTRLPAGGLPLINVDEPGAYASLTLIETGRAVCAWRDSRDWETNDLDIYAQSLTQGAASQDAMSLLLVLHTDY